jgi:non-homologous end joining protein Ku
LRNLIEAKQKNLPLPLEEDEARPAKVINLMDALRQSVSQSANRTKRPAAATRRPVQGVPKKGPVSVGVGRRKHRAA